MVKTSQVWDVFYLEFSDAIKEGDTQQKQFVNLTKFFSYLKFNTNNSVYL